MIDLRATTCTSSLSQGCNCTNTASVNTLNTMNMDHDWYYKWLLFSHLQTRDWQHQLLSNSVRSASNEMTLVTAAEYTCCLCKRGGQTVKHSPSTVTRLLGVLNLSALPSALSKSELDERIGLCDSCEKQLKKVEEADTVREKLKESLKNNLEHLSTPVTGKL